MRILTSCLLILLGVQIASADPDVTGIVDAHVLPRYAELAAQSQALADAATASCNPTDANLRAAYHDAFDAWTSVSHLRFGPSEAQERAFALAFWPDARGATPKALSTLIRDADPVIETLEGFQTVSIAARGLYALEFLLYDPGFASDTAYSCALIRIVTADIADLSRAIHADWDQSYGDLMRNAGSNDTYRSNEEAARQFFTALSTALEFTSDVRLARPLGTFDRPRPKRAEARRSGRSQRHVILSLQATRDLGARLSAGDAKLDGLFDRALSQAAALEDPVFAGVAEPQSRFRVEALRQSVENIREHVATVTGPSLGLAAGFNSLDGD